MIKYLNGWWRQGIGLCIFTLITVLIAKSNINPIDKSFYININALIWIALLTFPEFDK